MPVYKLKLVTKEVTVKGTVEAADAEAARAALDNAVLVEQKPRKAKQASE